MACPRSNSVKQKKGLWFTHKSQNKKNHWSVGGRGGVRNRSYPASLSSASVWKLGACGTESVSLKVVEADSSDSSSAVNPPSESDCDT